MILPFVREIFAELEQSSSFDRVRRHLSLGVGRRRLSGLTNTARSLYLPLLARAAHTVPDHSFNASLDSCNTCHAAQMHETTDAVNGTSAPLPVVSTQETELASVTPEPDPVSPIGFSALAGLLGLAGGMVLAPWLEKWYQRTVKHGKDENDG